MLNIFTPGWLLEPIINLYDAIYELIKSALIFTKQTIIFTAQFLWHVTLKLVLFLWTIRRTLLVILALAGVYVAIQIAYKQRQYFSTTFRVRYRKLQVIFYKHPFYQVAFLVGFYAVVFACIETHWYFNYCDDRLFSTIAGLSDGLSHDLAKFGKTATDMHKNSETPETK